MSNLGMILLIVFMGLVGGASTLYVVIGLPAYVIWKILRKIRTGEKIVG